MKSKKLNVALAGLGTVGSGVFRLLQKNAALIEENTGCAMKVVAVSAGNRNKKRDIDLTGIDFVDDPLDLPDRKDVDVVCELIGGAEGVPRALCEKTLKKGKPLITANKALLAHHGVELAMMAERSKTTLSFEASVAGGVPIIKTMREAMQANNILSVQGILNGTCNYILSRMTQERLDFSDALAHAQKQGYAEADPSADVDGHDAAHKLSILGSLAFGIKPDVSLVAIEGINRIGIVDLDYARQLGCRIKLLGVAKLHGQKVEMRVSPCLVPLDSPLAPVDGVVNAVLLRGDALGGLTLVGLGAGGEPTASAVVSDLIDIARGLVLPPWIRPTAHLHEAVPCKAKESVSKWYIRIQVTDRAGVLADIAAILRDHAISIESLLQHGMETEHSVPVIIVTHQASDYAIRAAVARMAQLETVWEPPLCLRIEQGEENA